MAGTFIFIPPAGGGDSGVSDYWGIPAVSTSSGLPVSGAAAGQVYTVIDTVSLYMWDGDSWELIVDGTADVHGPASSTENALARYADTTGKVIENSGAVLDDSNNLTGLNSVTVPTVRGSSASGGDLQLSSTSDATKGNINLGTASTYDEANDRLGIGTTSPSVRLHIRDDSDLSAAGSGLIRLENRSDVADSDPHVEFRRARAANANLQNGDLAGAIDFHPRHGGANTNTAQIHCVYTGDGTTRLSDLRFDTSNGSAPAERMRIAASGQITLGNNPVTIDAVGGMSFSTTTAAFKPPILTTVQRDALTPSGGEMIFNSTNNRIEYYAAAPTSAWVSLSWGN